MTKRLSPFLTIGIPFLFMVFQLVCEQLVPYGDKPEFFSEGGPHERIQALVGLVAFIYAVRVFFLVKGKWLKLWFGIGMLGCFYIAGEELSWGQQVFGWATPEFWDDINDQGETNLHNTSDWLDQKPEILLQIGILVGGIIIPALKRWKPQKLPARFNAIYPSSMTTPTALFALFVKLVDTVQDRSGLRLFWRASEVLELYMYYFILIYLLDMLRRIRQPAAESA